jgi:hypothetical protein
VTKDVVINVVICKPERGGNMKKGNYYLAKKSAQKCRNILEYLFDDRPYADYWVYHFQNCQRASQVVLVILLIPASSSVDPFIIGS